MSLNVTLVYTGTGVGFVTAAVDISQVAVVCVFASGGTAQNAPGMRSPRVVTKLMMAEACGTDTCEVNDIGDPPTGLSDEMVSGVAPV